MNPPAAMSRTSGDPGGSPSSDRRRRRRRRNRAPRRARSERHRIGAGEQAVHPAQDEHDDPDPMDRQPGARRQELRVAGGQAGHEERVQRTSSRSRPGRCGSSTGRARTPPPTLTPANGSSRMLAMWTARKPRMNSQTFSCHGNSRFESFQVVLVHGVAQDQADDDLEGEEEAGSRGRPPARRARSGAGPGARRSPARSGRSRGRGRCRPWRSPRETSRRRAGRPAPIGGRGPVPDPGPSAGVRVSAGVRRHGSPRGSKTAGCSTP